MSKTTTFPFEELSEHQLCAAVLLLQGVMDRKGLVSSPKAHWGVKATTLLRFFMLRLNLQPHGVAKLTKYRELKLSITETDGIELGGQTNVWGEAKSLAARVLEAIQAMVPAHAPFLAAETGWDVSTEELDDGMALIVDGDAVRIQALGFFGMMTIGAHHQEHHLMLAKGRAPHR